MENKNVVISFSTGTVLKVIGILVILLFAYIIRDILLIVFISIIFAALIEPPINYLEDKKIPRGLGIVLIYVALLLFMLLTIRLFIPPMIEQVARLATNFPGLWEQMISNLDSFQQYSEEQGIFNNIQEGLGELQAGLQQAATGIYSFIISVFKNLINFLMILVITFYLVVQKGAINKLFKAVAPAQYHDYLINLFAKIQKKIGDWARGQLMLGLIIGALSFVGLIVLLPKYALMLALIAGITELIPYIGPILGAIPAVFLGFTADEISIKRGFAVLILYLVIQQVENNIIVPKVMQKQLGLNPVVVIIVMLIGARLAGIIGLILAIPVATSIGVIASDFIKKSELKEIKQGLDKEGTDAPS